MNHSELETYITETYGVDPDFPWVKYPDHEVFRHTNNRKWFALIMKVPKEKLGIPESGIIPIVNLKCDPLLAGPLRMESGIYPAYHMNKDQWISVALDGTVSNDKIKLLLNISFDLTKRTAKKVTSSLDGA